MAGLGRRDISLSQGLTLVFYSMGPLRSTFDFSSLRFLISSVELLSLLLSGIVHCDLKYNMTKIRVSSFLLE